MSEQLEIRCPKLGNQVTFAYCLREGGDIPCPRTIQCWHSYFPVEDYLRKKLTPAEWERCFNQTPKEKISTLIELIEAAKNKPIK
ncbi:MAG: hypothetical protein PVH55_00570 [Desulfobacterales bacterium]|jgi:hypothetical protein